MSNTPTRHASKVAAVAGILMSSGHYRLQHSLYSKCVLCNPLTAPKVACRNGRLITDTARKLIAKHLAKFCTRKVVSGK